MFSRLFPVVISRIGIVMLTTVCGANPATAQMVNLGQSDLFRSPGGAVQPALFTSTGTGGMPSHRQVLFTAATANGASAPMVGDPYATGTAVTGFSPLRPFGGLFAGGGQQLWPQLNLSQWGTPRLPGILGAADDQRGRLWFRADYLQWWTEGMDTPPLVTTSPAGTDRAVAAVVGESGTGVIFGGSQINDDSVPGFRLKGGFWLTPARAFGIEAEFFALDTQDDRNTSQSDGSTIIGRPFFDITQGRETAQLISFPGVASGSLAVDSQTDLKSFLVVGRAALNAPSGNLGCAYLANDDRIDWLIGYRYLDLDEQLRFAESVESLSPAAPGVVRIGDSFRTQNEFNGLQLGTAYTANFNRLSLESALRVALGYNTQRVSIDGSTSITEGGVTENFRGGLLAQRTNIGVRERDEFSMIPEITLNLKYRFRPWLHATVGYTLLYFPNVVRPGDQIDRDVNPNLLAPEASPLTGALRPRFRWVESDYTAHGLNVGAEFRF